MPKHKYLNWAKKVDIWHAINEYVHACGGDTSSATVGNVRMAAVVAVEKELEKLLNLDRGEYDYENR